MSNGPMPSSCRIVSPFALGGVVHLPGKEVVAAGGERGRRRVHRVAHVQDEAAGQDRQLLVLAVPVRRDLVAGRHLEAQRERRLLRRIAVQHRQLRPLGEVGRRGAPLDLGRRRSTASGLAASAFFAASAATAGTAANSANTINGETVLIGGLLVVWAANRNHADRHWTVCGAAGFRIRRFRTVPPRTSARVVRRRREATEVSPDRNPPERSSRHDEARPGRVSARLVRQTRRRS